MSLQSTSKSRTLSRAEAYEILDATEDTPKEELKRIYITIALTNHPDQKTSTPETLQIFEDASFAYKRVQPQQKGDWVEMSSLLEQFSCIFRYRMKTETGYVYFMYNPFTGLPDSSDEDKPSARNRRRQKKLEYNEKWNEEKRIVEVDPSTVDQLQKRANECANELLENEEKNTKKKANKRRKKKLRKKEKKRKAKEEKTFDDENNEVKEENALKLSKDHHRTLLKETTITKEITKETIKVTEGRNKNTKEEEMFSTGLCVQNGKLKEYKKLFTAHERKISNDSGSETTTSDSDEPGWDEQSAFFSKAGKNMKNKQKPIKAYEQNNELPSSPKAKSHDPISESRQLAMEGNKKAGNGEYEEAVQLFTKAIRHLNTDCRYFGNRSYCFDRLELYDRALDDADTAISLSSAWAKGYFRKGRALAGLKRYVEAESAYVDVLKLDKQCVDAEQELHSVRMKHLMDMGFAKDLCEVALRKKGTIQLALDELLSGVLADTELKDVYVSDEEDSALLEAELKKRVQNKESETFEEVDYNSLWIGNLTTRVTEKALVDYFRQFGEVSGITTLYVRRCAFVNFASTESAKRALLARDTIEICDTLLIIRYPDRAFSHAAAQARYDYRTRRECFYWRNRGCRFGAACRYLHVPANRGIDVQTVERTPYQSIVKY